MIQITPQMRVLVAIESVDGRKGIDSLMRLCQERLAEDPFSGARRSDKRHSIDHRRNRNRQGTGNQGHPQKQPASSEAIRSR